MRRLKGIKFLLALALVAAPAFAVEPDEILKDPALEARARSISAGLRCLVCQNQSIDDSNAAVARDLRILIREQLQSGKTDAEAVDFVVSRYGDFVLLKPRFALQTLVLWLGPFAILLAAGLMLLRRRTPHSQNLDLTAAEKAEIERLLRE